MIAAELIAQPMDTSNITITNHTLRPGTFNWRDGDTWFDKTNFDSSPYEDGHLVDFSTNTFKQNFRLLIPKGYDPNYKPGYPIMIVWHGAVERGNCYENPANNVDNCYYATRSWNPNTPPPPGAEGNFNDLLNNDHQLLHGANYPHLDGWNKAGTMKIDDPALPTRAFPGFVVFPQNLNGWNSGEVQNSLRILRLLIKKYNIDEDRVYTHGLSNGGWALQEALRTAPWMFAAGAAMSAIDHGGFRNEVAKVSHIPLWYFQGGRDNLPTPFQTERTVRLLREAGGNVRYTLYPNLEHGTWNTAYREPDFFTFFLGNIRSDIHIAYGSPTICGTNNQPARLSVPEGFFAYQWELNGTIIPGANSHTYEASVPGVYRARYSRVSATPSESEWNRWSSPVTVTEVLPSAPVLSQIRSLHLQDLNGSNTARLSAPEGYTYYYWEKDGQPTSINTNQANPVISAGTDNANMGRYTVRTAGYDNCPSEPSNVKAVFYGGASPYVIPDITGFSGTLTGPTSVLLRWNDVSGSERHYEIWRRTSEDNSSNGWTFVALTDEDAIQYEDRNLLPGTEYWYKIRAVSNEGRSRYAPGESKTNVNANFIITTQSDNTPPTPPQNLTAVQHDTDIATQTVSISLSWDASTDAGGISNYQIQYGSATIDVPANQTQYIVEGLPLNQTYGFRVVARDNAGNVSQPSNQANANTYIDGFFWEHRTGAFTDLRDITDVVWDNPEFEGRSPNLTLEPALQEEFLVFRFYGYFYLSTSGDHQFRVRANDGVALYIDGQRVAVRNTTKPDGTCDAVNMEPMYLESGTHTMEVRYYQYIGTKCLSLEWKGPDTGRPLTTWIGVPDERIRSYPAPPEPQIPPVPTELVAEAVGMTQINLSWTMPDEAVTDFEIYRSASENGTFTVLGRTDELSFSDQKLLPGTTYFYKLKALSESGASAFSETASATTEVDTEIPTQPGALTLFTQTLTTASIAWTASEDNTMVAGYEIWVNNTLHSTAPQNYHLIEGLQPLQQFSVFVVAFDANGNKSEPSNTLVFETNTPETFYSKPSGPLNVLSSWGKNPNGTGEAPLNFSTNGSYFVVTNRDESAVGGNWKVDGNVSKIIVPAGVTLMAETQVQGRVEVQDGGTFVVANATPPSFVNLGVNSTVEYNSTAPNIQVAEYGNLVLNGTGNKTFPAGTTTVHGTLTAADGIAIKGVTNNQSTLVLYGDLNYTGSPAFTPSEVGVALDLRKAGTQTLNFAGKLDLFRLSAAGNTTVVVDGDNTSTLAVGSGSGGGLVLEDGSTLQLGNNTLQLIGRATINSADQKGVIAVNNGTLDITSAATQHSNLYLDPVENNVFFLRSNLSGSGTLIAQSPVIITDGLKITGGTFNANGMVTLVSNAEKSANLQAIENNGRVIGAVNVQRFISQKPRTYRYISSPVEGTTIADWQLYFPITGPFDGTTKGSGLTKQYSLFVRERSGWVGYPDAESDKTAPIEKGRGYAAFIRNTTAFTMTNRGVPHQGDVDFDLFDPNPDIEEGSWNLLGNPYASTIAWNNDANAWTKQNIGSVIAVRDNVDTNTGQFQYYDAITGTGTGPGEGGTLEGGRIAQGQAFWVQATGPDPALTIKEPAKSTGQQQLYREGTPAYSHVRLRLAQANKADVALVVFTDFGTDELDKEFDGVKMSNDGLFNLATVTADGKAVAINNVNDVFCTKRLWVDINNAPPGDYKLEVPSPDMLIGVGSLQLVDHFTGNVAELIDGKPYNFSVTTDTASYGMYRFELVFGRPQLSTDIETLVSVECKDGAEVRLKRTQPGASYVLLTENMKVAGSEQTSTGNDVIFTVPSSQLNEGTTRFKVQASFKGCATSLLPDAVQVEYYGAPKVSGPNVYACLGSPATLNVQGTGSISHFEWWNGDVQIKGAQSAEFVTGAITEETTYYVNAVTPNGCRGPKSVIMVTPDELAEPEILVQGDTLYSSVFGGEYTWIHNGKEILTSANANYFVPEKSGEYILKVRSGACLKESRAFVVTSVAGELRGNAVHVFPNPTSWSNINVRAQLRSVDPVRISILDGRGRKVYSVSATPDEVSDGMRLKVHNPLAPGLYFLLMEQGSHTEKIKLIVSE